MTAEQAVEAGYEVLTGKYLMPGNGKSIIEFGTAIANRMTYRDMLKAMKPHPSFAEGVQEALEALEGRSIHSAPVRK